MLFPLDRLAIGLLLCGWVWLAGRLQIGAALFSGVATALPVLITGGIHLDGFCDTLDALGSRQPQERKLEILKDSNSGAFAVIGCGLYFLLTFVFWMEWYPQGRYTWMLALGFVLSRTLSGLSVVRFPCAKNSGLLAMFSHAAAKKRTAWVLFGYLILCGGAMLLFGTFVGAAVLLLAPRSVWVLSSCFLQRIWRDDRRCSGLVFAIVRTGAARWNGAFTKMDLKKEGAVCGWS